MPEDFSLDRLIGQVLNESPNPDPYGLVGEVFDAIPAHRRSLALRQALHRLVPAAATRQRMSGGRPDEEPAPKQGAPYSHKWATIGASYKRLLHERLSIPGGEWKWIRDCTRSDLLAAAGLRRDQADKLVVKAVQLEWLAGLCESHGVATPADLPDSAFDGEDAA